MYHEAVGDHAMEDDYHYEKGNDLDSCFRHIGYAASSNISRIKNLQDMSLNSIGGIADHHVSNMRFLRNIINPLRDQPAFYGVWRNTPPFEFTMDLTCRRCKFF